MYSDEDTHTHHSIKRHKTADRGLNRATDVSLPSRYSSLTARTQNSLTKLRRSKHRVRIPKANDKVSENDRLSIVGNVIPSTATEQISSSNHTFEAYTCGKFIGEQNTGVGLVTVGREKSKTAVVSPPSYTPSDDAYFLTQRSVAISTHENGDSAQQMRTITAADDLSVSENVVGIHESSGNVSAAITPLSSSPLPPPSRSSEGRNDDDSFSRPGSESQVQNSVNLESLLVDLPSDAFASSPDTTSFATVPLTHAEAVSKEPSAVAAGLSQRMTNTSDSQKRQLTLDGLTARNRAQQGTMSARRNWPLMHEDEKPTHHTINEEAMRTWIYPTNLGTIRDYQFNIVARALYHNLLVALPTGLGKTFIAATVMLNWFRWTQSAQIIFVAPTKPLVAQQVESCFSVAGIPRSQTSLLTGGISPGLRAEAWATKRVFFLTPQTIMNDLKTGICDPKRIVLLVVDEAHRATGGYAYVELVKFLHRFNQSFRVLALTATPGSSVESVQAVIDGLSISRVEIRTESSLDLQKYVYARRSDTVLLDNSLEMEHIMDLLSRSLQPVVNKLCQLNAYYTRDPMRLNAFGLTQARQRWMASDAGRHASMSLKAMANNMFTILASLAHSIDLLKYHGLVPFYNNIKTFQSQHSSSNGKVVKEILDSEFFKNMTSKLHAWTSQPDFIGHPKLEHLQEVVLNHFLDCGHGTDRAVDQSSSASTRVMIFAQYRGSAEEIVRVLSRHSPIVRPHVFVGQAAGKTSEGMDQKRQLEIIKDYKQGAFNTLVATSIGEEGLDIGEIDLIVCYDSSASPIRMLQRAGRTGRKRAGRITLLLMNGKEADSFKQAKDNYEKMQAMIASGSRFKFHDSRSPRIVPRHIKPEVEKRDIDIPAENHTTELPEPRARGRAPKRPAKRFHMPDGVPTGFTDASNIIERAVVQTLVNPRKEVTLRAHVKHALEHIPRLIDVVLTKSEEADFEHRYLHVANDDVSLVHHPRMTAYPAQQRKLGPIGRIGHAQGTSTIVQTLRRIRTSDSQDFIYNPAMIEKEDLDQLCGPDQSLRKDIYGSRGRSLKRSAD